MIVLVPALEPDQRLPRLVAALLGADPDLDVLVVDDGSGAAYDAVFADAQTAGARVMRHSTNRGKGAALKSGFAEIQRWRPGEDVVTADADGQHRVGDILRVVEGLREDAAADTPALILGCRGFAGPVPLRSRMGNAVSRALFRLAAGWSLSDTQTGLRGIPSSALAWAQTVPGTRFEYELNVLLRSRGAGIAAREVTIETVYLEQNASSHFRPLADSVRVVLPLGLFAGSSLLAFLVDTVLMLALTAATGSLVFSIVAARVVSATANFAVNRRVVFRRRGTGKVRQGVRYALLAVALLASNIVWMEALTGAGVPLVAAKIATEAVLFLTSYGVQKAFVFPAPELESPAKPRHRNRIDASAGMNSEAITSGRIP